MRLPASRIRSINRAIARAQSSAWSAPDRNRRYETANPTDSSPERGQIRETCCVPKGRSIAGAGNRYRRENVWDERVLLAAFRKFDRVSDPGYNHTATQGGRTPCMPSSV